MSSHASHDHGRPLLQGPPPPLLFAHTHTQGLMRVMVNLLSVLSCFGPFLSICEGQIAAHAPRHHCPLFAERIPLADCLSSSSTLSFSLHPSVTEAWRRRSGSISVGSRSHLTHYWPLFLNILFLEALFQCFHP